MWRLSSRWIPKVQDCVYGTLMSGSNTLTEFVTAPVNGYVGVVEKAGGPNRFVSRSSTGRVRRLPPTRLPCVRSRLVVIVTPGLPEMIPRYSPMPRRLYAIEYPARTTVEPVSPRTFFNKLFEGLGLHAKPKLGA